jgi:hypothetical protein
MLILVLTIIGVIFGAFGALTFFGLTAPRLAQYAKEVTGKRSRSQILDLVFAVVMTGLLISIAIKDAARVGLTGSVAIISLIPQMWFHTVIDEWKLKLSRRATIVTVIVRAALYLSFLSLMTASIVATTVDEPLWHNLAPFWGGTAGGIGIFVLAEYVKAKRKKKRASEEVTRDSTL